MVLSETRRASVSMPAAARAKDKWKVAAVELGLREDPVQAVLKRTWECQTPVRKPLTLEAGRDKVVHRAPRGRRASCSGLRFGHEQQGFGRRHSWAGIQALDVTAAENTMGQLALPSAKPRRRYSNCIDIQEQDACPEPELYRPAAGCRRAPSIFGGLGYIEDGERDDEALAKQFADVSMKFHMLLHQTSIVMNDVMASIRDRHLQDNLCLAHENHTEALTEISHAVSTSCYFFAKWCHQIEPRKCTRPPKPSRPVDCSVNDLLSQIHSGVSRMEVHGSKLVTMLMPIVKTARLAHQQADSVRSVRDIARSHGLNTDEFSGIAMHLDHLLSTTQGLRRSLGSVESRPHTAPSIVGAARVAAKHKEALSRASSTASTGLGSNFTSRSASPDPTESAGVAYACP